MLMHIVIRMQMWSKQEQFMITKQVSVFLYCMYLLPSCIGLLAGEDEISFDPDDIIENIEEVIL